MKKKTFGDLKIQEKNTFTLTKKIRRGFENEDVDFLLIESTVKKSVDYMDSFLFFGQNVKV